jgi:DNA-binding GntR family transcriptional regulator
MAGVGSFVAEQKIQSTLVQIAIVATEMRHRGHDDEREVISAERRLAPTDVGRPPQAASARAMVPTVLSAAGKFL